MNNTSSNYRILTELQIKHKNTSIFEYSIYVKQLKRKQQKNKNMYN